MKQIAKADQTRRDWLARRGKATRQFIRDLKLTSESSLEGLIFPPYVTEASVKLELRMRDRRREAYRAAKVWREAHPIEAEKLLEDVRDEVGKVLVEKLEGRE